MSQSITYSTLLDVRQHLRYNVSVTDANGNSAYQLVAVVTDIKTQGSDGSIRDIQTITNYGGIQATPFTPQQIYTIINGSAAGQDLAAELKTAYNQATATVVS